MEHIRQYLLSVIAAAILCAAVQAITQKKGASSAIIKLIAGIFLTVTVITPWTKLSFTDITEYAQTFTASAETAVSYGTAVAQEETAAIIKSRSEAYILDKATSLGLTLQVAVTVSDASPPLPESVVLTGKTSPYTKERLAHYIANDLGIPEADQTWN